jgi:putative membrane protein
MTALPMAWGGGLAIFGGLLGVAVWILLIALIMALVRGIRPDRASGGDAMRVLEERYARGEITREEFLERQAVLGGGAGASPADVSR